MLVPSNNMINQIFKAKIGRNVNVYIDDMHVKSIDKINHISNLRETFELLKDHQKKLDSPLHLSGHLREVRWLYDHKPWRRSQLNAQMRLQGCLRKVSWLYGHKMRCRSQPRRKTSCP